MFRILPNYFPACRMALITLPRARPKNEPPRQKKRRRKQQERCREVELTSSPARISPARNPGYVNWASLTSGRNK
jgi:hypothetical protein